MGSSSARHLALDFSRLFLRSCFDHIASNFISSLHRRGKQTRCNVSATNCHMGRLNELSVLFKMILQYMIYWIGKGTKACQGLRRLFVSPRSCDSFAADQWKHYHAAWASSSFFAVPSCQQSKSLRFAAVDHSLQFPYSISILFHFCHGILKVDLRQPHPSEATAQRHDVLVPWRFGGLPFSEEYRAWRHF